MAVKVWPRSEHDGPAKFESGTKWFIDEDGLLHVIDANGTHVAAYAKGYWSSVEVDQPATGIKVTARI